jgi:hypothetical protein
VAYAVVPGDRLSPRAEKIRPKRLAMTDINNRLDRIQDEDGRPLALAGPEDVVAVRINPLFSADGGSIVRVRRFGPRPNTVPGFDLAMDHGFGRSLRQLETRLAAEFGDWPEAARSVMAGCEMAEVFRLRRAPASAHA